jgi:hypothetical protein
VFDAVEAIFARLSALRSTTSGADSRPASAAPARVALVALFERPRTVHRRLDLPFTSSTRNTVPPVLVDLPRARGASRSGPSAGTVAVGPRTSGTPRPEAPSRRDLRAVPRHRAVEDDGGDPGARRDLPESARARQVRDDAVDLARTIALAIRPATPPVAPSERERDRDDAPHAEDEREEDGEDERGGEAADRARDVRLKRTRKRRTGGRSSVAVSRATGS